MRNQISTNADFSTDAMSQIRAEFEDVKQSVKDPASNAGGILPGSSGDVPLVNNEGKPLVREEFESFSVRCAYCEGSVPRVIAEYCSDCEYHFHPGHYHTHREEWPCPLVDHDLCRWCDEHIEEHQNVMECSICLPTTHTECYAQHCPCPDGWATKKTFGNRVPPTATP